MCVGLNNTPPPPFPFGSVAVEKLQNPYTTSHPTTPSAANPYTTTHSTTPPTANPYTTSHSTSHILQIHQLHGIPPHHPPQTLTPQAVPPTSTHTTSRKPTNRKPSHFSHPVNPHTTYHPTILIL